MENISEKDKKIVIELIVFFAIAMMFVAFMPIKENENKPNNPITKVNELTWDKYESLEIGDTYEIIKEKIGQDCYNYYSSDNEDWYTCVDKQNDKKRIVIELINNKLKSKSSSGLK